MLPIIVSYYTENTGYEREVQNLISSCDDLRLTHQIEKITSLGSWEKNCCYKPYFLLEKLEELKQPILWVDADAVFLQQPNLFHHLPCDMALRSFDHLPLHHPSKIITGTLYLQNTQATKKLLTQWGKECQRLLQAQKGEVWDQIGLRNAILSGHKAEIVPLPDSYCAIYDKKRAADQEVVILHYQASRLYKKVIDKQLIPFWEEEGLSQKERAHFSREID